MKINARLAILTVISMLLLLMMGCAKDVEGFDGKELEEQQNGISSNKEDGPVVLKLWSWYSFQGIIDSFKEEHEGIIIEEELFGFGECEEVYMKAITSGEGPDILIFDSSFFGNYTVNGILQNLLEEPCEAGKYQNDFLGWESGFSIGNDELLSLTVTTSPYVTFYRADIMEEYGFPHEPEEFGKFIKDPKKHIRNCQNSRKRW